MSNPTDKLKYFAIAWLAAVILLGTASSFLMSPIHHWWFGFAYAAVACTFVPACVGTMVWAIGKIGL